MKQDILKELFEREIFIKKIYTTKLELEQQKNEGNVKKIPEELYEEYYYDDSSRPMKSRYYYFEDESAEELELKLKMKEYDAVCKTRDFTKSILITAVTSILLSVFLLFFFLLPAISI
jgi:hypothetical protein